MNIKDEEIKWVLMRHVRTKEEKGKIEEACVYVRKRAERGGTSF